MTIREETTETTFVEKIQNHPFIAGLLLVAALIGALLDFDELCDRFPIVCTGEPGCENKVLGNDLLAAFMLGDNVAWHVWFDTFPGKMTDKLSNEELKKDKDSAIAKFKSLSSDLGVSYDIDSVMFTRPSGFGNDSSKEAADIKQLLELKHHPALVDAYGFGLALGAYEWHYRGKEFVQFGGDVVGLTVLDYENILNGYASRVGFETKQLNIETGLNHRQGIANYHVGEYGTNFRIAVKEKEMCFD